MTIIYTYQKSKKRKPNAKQRELAADWEKLLKKYEPKKVVKTKTVSKMPKLSIPQHRNPYNIPSLNSNNYDTFKKDNKVYTGDAMLGIGTLHKSNAVPVFSKEQAEDQANMRR
jgi:hypothetical protein